MTTFAVPDLESVELQVSDGTMMIGHVARPKGALKDAPSVIVMQDAYGWTPFLADVTQRFADAGFLAIAPEFYHRDGHRITMPYDEELLRQGKRPTLTPAGEMADGKAAFDWLHAQTGNDRITAYGFCMGGRIAYQLNAHVPLKAAVTFYGVSPTFDECDKQHGPLLMIWAGLDHHIKLAERRGMADALDAAKADHTQLVFGQAEHGFFCHAREWVYSKSATEQSWAISMQFFRDAGVLPAA
jgi:carboxymethylenebutenolidase